jgi:hypothetical protein
MHRLIDEDGRVRYGCIDGPVRFNHQDFILRGFFGRPCGALRRRLALGAFTYVGILGEGWLLGMAAVRLGYASNVFAACFDLRSGRVREWTFKGLPGAVDFPLDPDEGEVRFRRRGAFLRIAKSHARETLEVEARFKGLEAGAVVPYGLGRCPLRVVNPSCGDPDRFTFTEKCAALAPAELSVRMEGRELFPRPREASVLYDWSGGFFNRNTNWLWAALAGTSAEGLRVGANFAALANESFYPENAFWIGGSRTRVPRVVFEYDPADPGREDWRVHTEDGRVDLRFRALGERGERSRLPFVKVNFRQFAGEYTGWIRDGEGRSARVERVPGVAEVHKSVW